MNDIVEKTMEELKTILQEKEKFSYYMQEMSDVIQDSVGVAEEVKAVCVEQTESARSIEDLVRQLGEEMKLLNTHNM